MSAETTTAAADFAQALAELADGYPTNPEGTAHLTITVTDPATGEQSQVPIEPGPRRTAPTTKTRTTTRAPLLR